MEERAPVISLAAIRELQFTDLPRANQLLLEFFQAKLPFEVRSVQIRVLAVSLNSINGIIETDCKLFFKAHIESQVADREYYNTEVLADAGYPILKPVLKATESAAQHVMLYEIVESPTMFDACRAVEQGTALNEAELLAAQEQSDRELLALYRRNLRWAAAEEHAQNPIHQLFYHRLSGGRFDQFYVGQQVKLPNIELPFEELANLRWVINGLAYPGTLKEIVDRAIRLLRPATAGPAVAGHGDAHNGNVFFQNGSLLYFDPAFAGWHSPLLDLVKPLYHNVHAQWMYFPQEKSSVLDASLEIRDGVAHVRHNYVLTPIREATRRSKTELVLRPLIQDLAERGWLEPEWKQYIQSALMCCPLLTMNLCDSVKFPVNVTLLGFAHAIVMAHEDPLPLP